MRSIELIGKIIDFSLNDSLLIGLLTKVMSIRIQVCICEYLLRGPPKRDPTGNKSQGYGSS